MLLTSAGNCMLGYNIETIVFVHGLFVNRFARVYADRASRAYFYAYGLCNMYTCEFDISAGPIS